MEAELSILFNDIRILQMGRMFQLAATFVVLYDHVLCSQREVDLIWKRQKSLVSYLYFTTRYFGDAISIISAILFMSSTFSVNLTCPIFIHSLMNDTLCISCRILFQFQSYGPFVAVWATQTIMQLRIYAMYRKSKKILAFTGICFILEIAAICTVLALNFDHSLTYTNEPIPGLLNMCATSTINRSFTAIYVPIFCFELLLFVLAIFVVFKHMKNTRTISGKRIHNTMATLVKYNTIYFFVEMAGCGIATALYLGLPSIYLEITNSALIATTIILGTRLVLGTRNFYSDPSAEDDSNLSHGTTVLNPSFIQPSLSGPFSSHMEMSMTSVKGYHLDISNDVV
ncbi:hypothetical protein DFJ58DRAFT_729194 [Suillus subalutaceus]|uniref:uncharacterized protein n=1 Tax=Suillus subalutaceus TaxID=48586 RepID=UPI001B8618B7|nr:uncharacterized protein DFJ58DRAFT_729194 [Suillus subalutaceus]KAG1850613.1 hypothetical protein DFJ58DRAFT_729194 [Suillus subalutaceus]